MNRDVEDLGGADPYELLGVPPDAGAADIQRAYRRLAPRTHPDTGGDEESQKRLNLARDVLLDPVRRIEMNRRLRQRRGEHDKITEEQPPPEPEPEPAPYEDQFDWTYGTSPSPPQPPHAQDAPEQESEEPPPPEPEPGPAPYEDQFDWTYGTSPSPPQPPHAQDAAPEPEWEEWEPPPPYRKPVYRKPVHQQPPYGHPAPPGYPYRRRWNGLAAIASFVLALVVVGVVENAAPTAPRPSYQWQPPSYQWQPPSYQWQPPSYQWQPPSYQWQPPSYQWQPSSPKHGTVQGGPMYGTMYVYQLPLLSAPKIGALTNGTDVTIQCTTQGDMVTVGRRSSSLWDRIDEGYMPDVAVYTGTDQAVMPNCTG